MQLDLFKDCVTTEQERRNEFYRPVKERYERERKAKEKRDALVVSIKIHAQLIPRKYDKLEGKLFS